MKRIVIICEGQTEQRFCNEVLAIHFLAKNILIQSTVISKSGGGMVSWPSLKRQILEHLNNSYRPVVTTFIDFYGIHDKHLFPYWESAKQIADKGDRLTKLEQAMRAEIDEALNYKFVPYIQLHEFEGLLFNNIEIFRNNFTDKEADITELETTITQYPNPELINDSKESTPSQRLISLIKGYKKIIDGVTLAREIGLQNIRAKSPRFNSWIETLENI